MNAAPDLGRLKSEISNQQYAMSSTSAPHESKIYHGLASWYERLFSPFFRRRIHATIRSLNIPAGARVLEVGVGTGLSLESYPRHAQVTGVDLSDAMLDHAREKISRHGWENIEVRQMDALNLDFPDESFDYVMAFHLVSVVPDSDRAMQEMARVCKPGGRLVIINHLRSPRRLIAGAVDLLAPVTRRLGWRTTLTFEDLVRPAPIEVQRRYKSSPVSLFTIVIAEKKGNEAAGAG
jgi:phosphatidylethanolamine/phosphatidyl-N-methylethanolamine N-methyltransferase